VPNDAIPPAIGVPLTWHRRVRWVLLALVPSSLLLALTTYLTTDVAAVPLLWIVPLSIYLLTFVLTFARRPPLPHNLMLWGQPLFVLSLVITMGLGMQRGEGVIAVIHLLAFFFTAMVCHGELARNRPDVTHLTEFYLWISVGGVLGGVFNVVIAPQIFNRVLEYPIAVVLACALRPSLGKRPPRKISPALDVVLPLALGSALLYWIETPVLHAKWLGEHGSVIVFGVYALICLVFIRRPIRFALSVAALLLAAGAGYAEDNIIYRARSFFGVYRVIRYPEHHMLQNGTTTHGAQSTLPDRRQEPLTYYHRDGPLGQIFATLFPGDTNRRVAIVGLGAGTIACYGRPNESWTYYEIDPLIMRIASDTTLFTYLRDCPPHKRIVLGDARLSLAAAPDSSYDLILLDAFSSDAIPVHLMTREALAMYMRKLAPGGSIAFHISNRYLHLEPVVSELARDARLPGAVGEDESLTDEQKDDQKSLSHWVLLSRRAADHAAIERLPGWAPLAPRGNTRLWTDDFSDILSVIHFR
jgi:spermidine synthase